jgi:uncharacterized membrane-anchored protein YhcB (DUF1043 family)
MFDLLLCIIEEIKTFETFKYVLIGFFVGFLIGWTVHEFWHKRQKELIETKLKDHEQLESKYCELENKFLKLNEMLHSSEEFWIARRHLAHENGAKAFEELSEKYNTNLKEDVT